MKSIAFYSLLILLSACSQPNENHKEASTTDTTIKQVVKTTKNTQTQKLKFINFTFGDAEHYTFETTEGKIIEFGFCKDTTINFAIEVPPNDQNQGFEANPKVQGKWFLVKSIVENRPLYPDGPLGDVEGIVEVSADK